MLKTSRNKSLFYFLLIMLFALLLVVSKNLFTPNLSYDEAGQVFISKGLNHDSDPLEKEGGILNVIENNAYYNLDPGGFSILLHFWSKISTYHVWLRLLPFLFFIGIVFSFMWLIYNWTKDEILSVLAGFLPIFIPVLFDKAFEIRAYTMEGMGTMMGIVVLESLKKNLSCKRLFLWGCVLGFFITSRYSEIIVIFCVSLYVLYIVFRSNTINKKKILYIIAYALPVFLALGYSYFFAMAIQNKSLEPIYYLNYLNSSPEVLLEPLHIIYLLIVLIFTVLLIYFHNKKKQQYETLLFVTVSTNMLCLILSFAGIHPWTPLTDRCLSMSILVFASVFFFGIIFIKPVWLLIKKKITKNKRAYFSFLLLFCVFFSIVLYSYKKHLFIQGNEVDVEKIDLREYDKIYVDRYASPGLRYLFEYGKLRNERNELGYPDKFTFAKYGTHAYDDEKIRSSKEDYYENKPKMNDYIGKYDLLITPELDLVENEDQKNLWKRIEGTTTLFVPRKSYE